MAAKKLYAWRLNEELVARVDRVAGPGQRTAFVEKAIDEKLAEHERFGRYHCPAEGCNFLADTALETCPDHDCAVEAA